MADEEHEQRPCDNEVQRTRALTSAQNVHEPRRCRFEPRTDREAGEHHQRQTHAQHETIGDPLERVVAFAGAVLAIAGVAAIGALLFDMLLLSQGQTSKEMARTLGLSPRTVETHRAHVFEKLGADSLAQLVRGYAALVNEPGTA